MVSADSLPKQILAYSHIAYRSCMSFVCHKRFRIISSSRAVNVGRSESFGNVPVGNIILAISSSLAVGRLWPIVSAILLVLLNELPQFCCFHVFHQDALCPDLAEKGVPYS